MKQSIYFLFVFILSLSHATKAHSYVVLIDPGHGGEEFGAMGKLGHFKNGHSKLRSIYEKDLSLLLAKKVKRLLDKKHSIYLTRSFDRTVSLNQRAEMAETVKADLFISIHFNSALDSQSNGFETYYLDNHADVAIKKVEQIENKELEGADKIINQILIDLVIQQTVSSSKKLSNLIHAKVITHVGNRYKIKDRGVKPGLFFVLALSKRPGVLIEAGFISNQLELNIISREEFINSYAKAISEGIQDYLMSLPPKDLSLL